MCTDEIAEYCPSAKRPHPVTHITYVCTLEDRHAGACIYSDETD